ncbi:phosphotransferase [Legionella sp. D16C41]|uniref:phosphotransferase n=1 Tax=Legionella sp. D16C41 TaxID=3402688 RepID=UPI003AF75845
MNRKESDEQIIDTKVIQAAQDLLQQRFVNACEIRSITFLSEPERRNIVLRLYLEKNFVDIPDSLILKQSLPEATDDDDKDAYARFARDWAGLEFLSRIKQSHHNAPTFYGGNKEHRFILLEDLGLEHISLVDSLTLPNRTEAIAALNRFMTALGSFHAASYNHVSEYETILGSINKPTESIQDELKFIFSDLLPRLELANKNLVLSTTPDIIQEAKDLIRSLFTPGSFTVLTHGDICPDNVFDHKDKELQLIDFEWAFVRNALLDGTYLRMSMPTCWCAKAIPIDVIEPLEVIYREQLKRAIPAASDDLAYMKAYTEACGFWLLQQTIPLLNSVIDKDRIGPSGPTPKVSLWKPEENNVRPRVLTRLQAFIDVATKNDHLPYLRKMAKDMLSALTLRWADTKPLEVYPAFREYKL